MIKNIPIYDITIDDDAEGIQLISMVSNPAVQSNFIKLAEQDEVLLEEVKLASNEEKQYVTGLVLAPEQLIYRYSEELGEYYIKFKESEIEHIRNKFFKSGNLKLSNIEHSQNDRFESYLIESWIVENPEIDKAKALGLTDVKKGAFYATYYIPDKNNWEIVSKNTNGFSLEGMFNLKPVILSLQDKVDTNIAKVNKILDEIEELLLKK